MATNNLTKAAGRHKKRSVCVAYAELAVDEMTTSADIYELMVFPEKTLVLNVSVVIGTANDSGTSAVADIGVDGGSEFLSAGDLTGAAETVLAGATDNDPTYLASGGTLTVLPTLVGTAQTAGMIRVCVSYVETDKVNGDLTNFSATA